MHRRQFLASLGCGAALGVTGLPSLLPEPTRWVWDRMPLFVGIGNAGVNFVNALGEMVPLEYRGQGWPWIQSKHNRLDGKSAEPLDADERTRLISSAIFDRHAREVFQVVLMAGLSRSTGGELISEIAERYMAEGASVSIVATLPFHFEGRHWRTHAERQLAVVESSGAHVVVIDNEASIAALPGNTTMLQAFRLANQKVVHAAAHEAWKVCVASLTT